MSDKVERNGRTVSVRRGAVYVERTFADEATAQAVAARLRDHELMRTKFLNRKGR